MLVYFNEFNVVCGKYRYLPYNSGLLRAYAEVDPIIWDNYEFAPFIYEMDTPANVLAKYIKPPDVAAFSVSMWNEQLNLAVAREVKARWPRCLIVFGGCHVPHRPEFYMMEHPFIDVCVKAEGEEAFREILLRLIGCPSTWDFSGLCGVTYRRGNDLVSNVGERPFVKDLDRYPSPYLTGMFDGLLNDGHQWQAIIETNRGCPFDCSFCYWAQGGLALKYKFHGMDYVKAEIDWCGRNHIPYVFGADSNWGMHHRDKELSEYMVETKRKHGYPDKFRVCFGKNTDEKIFQVASILHSADLEKGITLARQSNDEQTLKNIRRDNIKLATYRNLQARFNDLEVPVYSELILGLPGETVESWKRGIDELLTSGLRNQLFVYLCQILPNTELADPEYRERHKIQSKRIKLTEIHGTVRSGDWVDEYEDIVIATASMPHDEWREMVKFSWAMMFLHSMKAGFFVLGWLWDRLKIPPSEFISFIQSDLSKSFGWDNLLDRMLNGEGRGIVLPEYGGIYWDVEEAALLLASEDWVSYYVWINATVREFLESEGESSPVGEETDEIDEMSLYQIDRMPEAIGRLLYKWRGHSRIELPFQWNLPEYFDKLGGSSPIQLERNPQKLILKPKDFGGDRERFARETVLWGRKSGTMLVPCEWENVDV